MGAYRLLGRLGQGGQGVVYLGEDPGGRRVAVKVLKIEIRTDTKAKARFVREIAAARKVAPFCTARILAFDIEGELPFVASEYITGLTLQERVHRYGPIYGTDLDRLAIGTGAALAAIHGAHVVHCDLKPANVILGPDWPRVIDFGISRAIDGTGTQTIMGSPAYMSPERYQNASVGPAADIFSWAATIAFAAAGRAPFGHDSALSIMHRVMDRQPDLGGLSPGLDDLLRQCLQKDPADRPVATEVLLRLVANSGVKLEPEARRSIGELTTRVISPQTLRDLQHRRPRVSTHRLGEAAGAPVGPAAPTVPAARRVPAGSTPAGPAAAQTVPVGPTAPVDAAGSGALPGVADPTAAAATIPASGARSRDGGDADPAVASAAPDDGSADPAGGGALPPDASMERTLKLSGGRGETRKILSRPDPTAEVADGTRLTAEAPDAGRPDRGGGGATRWMRLRRAGSDVSSLAFAVVLGLLGAVAGYFLFRGAPATIAVGGVTLVVAYLGWILGASRRS